MNRHLRTIQIVFALVLVMCIGAMNALAEDAMNPRSALSSLKPPSLADSSSIESVEWSVRDGVDAAPLAAKEWTFLVYLCGSNLGDCAKADLIEMARSGFDEDSINVVAFTGGAPHWGGADIPNDRNTLIEVRRNVIEQVVEYPPSDMSISATLSHFLTLGVERYPAEKYALVLWDHGGGPIGGIFVDKLYNSDSMSVEALNTALRNSPFRNQKLAIIGFDACLMASVEIAESMEPYAMYMLASEETEPGSGWNYAFLGDVKSETSVEEIGRIIIDDYFDSFAMKPDEATHGNTMSCIDLSQINNVKFACDGFFKDSFEKLNRDTFVEYAKARNDSLAFGDAPYDLVDIGSFVKNLSIGDTEAKQRLEDSLVSAVLHTRSKDTYATGLSIYHPYNAGYNYLRNKETYDKIAPSDEYVQYIEYFTDFLTGQAQADWSSLSTLGQLKSKEEAVRDSTTGFSLLLTDEQLSFLAEVEFHAFESTDQGQTFALVSINPEVDTDGNSLISEYVHRALFITRGEGNDMLVLSEALPYDVISDKLYSMRATLIGHDASGDEVRQGIRLEFTFDETNSMVELLQLLALDSDGTYTTRHSIDPDDYEAIEFIRELRRPTSYSDSDTTLLSYDQWELVEARPYVMSLSEDWDLQMLHDTLNRDDLYVAFAFRDYQNYRYNSSLIRVAARPDKTNVLLLYDNSNCAVSIPYPKASAQGMRVNFRLTNKSDVESAILCVDNLRLNGRPTGLSMEVYGNAANDGMGIGEEQVGMLLIKAKLLEGLGTVTTMDFDIVIINALTDEVVYTEPVHGELEFDVSAFG